MLINVSVNKINSANWSTTGHLPDGTKLGVRGVSIFGAKGKHGYFINGKPTYGTGVTSPWHRYAKYWPELIKIGKGA